MTRSPARRLKQPVWFFDLDDTLHQASAGIFGLIDGQMTAYLVQHLQVSVLEADQLRRDYWHRYGATLLGLIKHHDINPHHFLAQTHDFDVVPHLNAESGLRRWARRLSGQKILLTNSPSDYAKRVLLGIGLRHVFDHFYAIENMRIHGHFRPKPSRSLFRALKRRHSRGKGGVSVRPILVDDNLDNLKAARAEGYATVLVSQRGTASYARPGQARRLPGLSYVDLRVRSVKLLASRAFHLHDSVC